MPKQLLDDKFCRTVPHPTSGQVLYFDEHKDAPAGFALRVTPGAKAWVMNYYVAGRQRRVTLPVGFGEAPLWGPKKARLEAAKLKTAIHSGQDPIGDRERAKRDQQRAQDEAVRREGFGFGALMQAYVEYLKAAGKPSWKEVDRAVERHIIEPRPELARRPADEITVDDVMPVFHKLTRAGKLREAEKLRSYLRAAYTAAKRARNDASMHAFEGFRISSNPLADLEVSRPKEAADKAAQAAKERKWALSEDQLRAYWRRIEALEGAPGAALRFHLLTGGQRVVQLSRLTSHDYDADRKTVTLRDTKGRRKVAHEHTVPLIPDAVKALEAMRRTLQDEDGNPVPPGPHLLTITDGKVPALYHNVWEALQPVVAAMIEAKEVDREFSLGTIRKTVESRLQALGVSREVRGHLLSHGLSGVQARHCEAHEYDEEKRAALRKLRALCDPPSNKVVPMRRRQAGE